MCIDPVGIEVLLVGIATANISALLEDAAGEIEVIQQADTRVDGRTIKERTSAVPGVVDSFTCKGCLLLMSHYKTHAEFVEFQGRAKALGYPSHCSGKHQRIDERVIAALKIVYKIHTRC